MDDNDVETIINNQAVIMAALLEHLTMAGGRDLAVKGLLLRLEELKLRKLDKIESGYRAQRQD